MQKFVCLINYKKRIDSKATRFSEKFVKLRKLVERNLQFRQIQNLAPV